MTRFLIAGLFVLLVSALLLGSGGCLIAEFEVSSLVIMPAEVAPGDAVTVSAEVRNVGRAEGTYVATLTVDGKTIETKEVTVKPGATETVSFTYLADIAGTHYIGVDGLAGTLKVLSPAEFEVTSLVITPAEVVAGEWVTIAADVTNIGGVEGAYLATLLIDGMKRGTQEVTVAPGASETVSFGVRMRAAGTSSIQIGEQTSTLKVLKPAEFEVTSLVITPAEVVADETVSVKADVKNVGEVEGTYAVTLTIDGVEVETKDITVGPGATETVTFTLKEEEGGTYKLRIDGLAATLLVLTPTEFVVSSLTLTPSVAGIGEGVTVKAEVENIGDIEGTYTAPLKIDGAVVETKKLWVGPGMRRMVSFEFERDEPGTYEVQVGEQTKTLTVKQGFYRSSSYGFSISYPTSWIGEETGELTPIVEVAAPAGIPIVDIYLGYLPEVQSPLEAASGFKEFVTSTPGSELISEGDVILADGTQGYQVVTTIPYPNYTLKFQYLAVVRGTQLFEILAYSLPENFDANKVIIDEILSSFQLEEPRHFGISRQESLTLFDTGPRTLDPALARETGSMLYIEQIFSGLVSLDRELRVVPEVAERWEVSEDGRVYTFYLRHGARFHDGKEIKAADFKYSLERACDPETGSETAETYLGDIVGVKEKLAGEAEEISGVRVIDDYTLEITIDAPKAYFLSKLTHTPAVLLDKANVESGEEWWRNPNGTGPFRLREWKVDELLILERNDIYYLEPAKVNYLVFRLWGGVPMRMYETDEIDVTRVYLGDIERVLDPQNPLNKELVSVPELSLWYVGFNAARPPFDDAKIRQAFSHAIDKEKIIEVVLKGTVERADGILPPGMPGYNELVEGLGFDVERAQQLIQESEYGDVSNLPPITLTTAGRGDVSDLDAALIDMWRQNLGVEVQVRQLEPETYAYVLKEEKDEMFTLGWVADYADPQNFLDILFHTRGEENTGEYTNLEVDALLEEARVEQDVAARMQLYQRIEQMLADDAACLPLFFDVNYVLVKPRVEGFVLTPMGVPVFKDISIKPGTASQAPAQRINVVSATTDLEFPTALTFNLEAESDSDITDIILQYRVKKISYAIITSEASPEFVSGERVETAWTWDMRKAGLPPGADIEYRWIIEDASAQREETPWKTVRFEDDRYGWKSLVSDKVTLFWYSGDQPFAQTLMKAAFDGLDKLARDTGAYLEQPVRIYIYGSSQELRGALVYPQEWTGGVAFSEYGIVVIGVPGDGLAWGKRAMVHELAHLVTYQMTFNPYGDIPTWLNEGISMYAEGDLTANFQSALDEAISKDSLISVQSLGGSFPAQAEEARLAYAESYSLVNFLISTYGKDKMLQLLEVFKLGSGYDDALLEVYGFDVEGLDDLWRQSLGLEPRATAALVIPVGESLPA